MCANTQQQLPLDLSCLWHKAHDDEPCAAQAFACPAGTVPAAVPDKLCGCCLAAHSLPAVVLSVLAYLLAEVPLPVAVKHYVYGEWSTGQGSQGFTGVAEAVDGCDRPKSGAGGRSSFTQLVAAIRSSRPELLLPPCPLLCHTHPICITALALCSFVSFLMNGPAAVLTSLAELDVVPPFDRPWMSTSLADFWSRWERGRGQLCCWTVPQTACISD